MTQRAYLTLSWTTRMFAVWCGLFAWKLVAEWFDCIISVLFVLPLWGALSLAASEAALFKRHAFINQYLNPQGLLSRLWSHKVALLLWQSIKALPFSLLLLVSVLFFETLQWLVLLTDIVLMAMLIGVISWLLQGEVKPLYCEPLAHQWAQWANAVLLWLIFVLIMFFSAHENYQGMAWEEVIRFSISNVAVSCEALAIITRLNAVSEALTWWTAQNRLSGLENPIQVLMAWFAFTAWFGVSFLVAWAYSRALAGVLSKPWRLFNSHKFSADAGQ